MFAAPILLLVDSNVLCIFVVIMLVTTDDRVSVNCNKIICVLFCLKNCKEVATEPPMEILILKLIGLYRLA